MDPSSVVEAEGAARTEELSRLLHELGSVRNHGSRLVLVEAPRGSGKTRLLQALRRQHLLGGGMVLEAWCAPSPPFGPVARLVAESVRWLREAGEPFTVPEALRCRPGCHPLWFEHQEEPAAPCEARRSTPSSRESFLRAALEPLRAVAELRLPLLLLHELDRADAGTLDWLAQLLEPPPPWAGEAPMPPLLVVASAGEPARLDAWASAMASSGRLQRMPLAPLSIEGVRRLLQSPRLARRVLQQTGGHVEAIERLLEATPPSPEEHWRRTFSALPKEARRLLEAVALLGRPAGEGELAACLAHEIEPSVLSRLLAHLEEEEWLLRTERASTWGLAREGDRARILASLPEEERRRLHTCWVEALATQETRRAEAVEHALHAGRVDLAARYVREAARALFTRHADREAVELLVRVVRATGERTPPDLLEAVVDMALRAGAPEPALPVAERLLRQEHSPELALRLGRLFRMADRLEEADRALRHAAGDEAPRAVRLAATAERAAVAFERDAHEEAKRLAHAVLREAVPEREDELDASISARNTLGKLALTRGAEADAERAFRRNLEDAEAAGLRRRTAHARINLAVVAIRRGDIRDAERSLHIALREARESGAPREEVFALANLAIAAMRRRRFDVALEGYRSALDRLRAMGLKALLARASVSLGELYLSLGDRQRARSLAEFAGQVGGTHWSPWARVEQLLLQGRCALAERAYANARACFEAAWHATLEQEPARQFDALRCCILVALEEGKVSEARQWFGKLPQGLGTVETIRTFMLKAELERACRGAERAIKAARRAAALSEEVEDPLLGLEAWSLLAKVTIESGRTEEARRAYERASRFEASLSACVPAEFEEHWGHRPARRTLDELADRIDRAAPHRASTPPLHIEQFETRRHMALRRRFPMFVGSSEPMTRVLERIDRVAGTDALVMVRGESGTGKELVAEALHAASRRAKGPLVKVNCAALVETLLLSELFGHERGAFTGATSRRRGRFELADGGTLFLDEIGDITPKTQVALLRVLQERTFERVGGTQSISVDVRIVAATNRDLERLVAEGAFREDLYYRLRCVTIDLPPLRARREDIPELAAHLLDRLARERGVPRKRLSAAAASRLQRHDWPGNVRELENVLRGAALFADRVLLRPEDIEPFLSHPAPASLPSPAVASPPSDEPIPSEPPPSAVPPSVPSPPDLEAALYAKVRDSDRSWLEWKKDLERACVAHALREAGGNITRAARLLGMKRPRLSQLVKEYGLGSLKREVRS